jgi:Pyruvate/2-oxoacid:ferredoxin oxidoreductase delta subunit
MTLFLTKESPSFRGRTITNTIKKERLMVPHVDVFKCTGCGTCIRGCPEAIIGLANNEAAILTDLCVEYGICAFVLPFVSNINELPNSGYETDNIMHLSKR